MFEGVPHGVSEGVPRRIVGEYPTRESEANNPFPTNSNFSSLSAIGIHRSQLWCGKCVLCRLAVVKVKDCDMESVRNDYYLLSVAILTTVDEYVIA